MCTSSGLTEGLLDETFHQANSIKLAKSPKEPAGACTATEPGSEKRREKKNTNKHSPLLFPPSLPRYDPPPSPVPTPRRAKRKGVSLKSTRPPSLKAAILGKGKEQQSRWGE